MVYSASGAPAFDTLDNPQYYLIQQSAWGLAGLAGLAIAARLDYHRYRSLALVLLAVAAVLLAVILVPSPLRVCANGACRWLRIAGPVSLQPAEFAKLALILYLSAWLASKRAELRAGKLMVPVLVVVGTIAALVVAEPD